MTDPRYHYRVVSPPGHDELARLEFEALTGERAPAHPPWNEREDASDHPGLLWARAGVDVGRAAYVAECCRLLARGTTLDEMLAAAADLQLRMERFRVHARKRRGTKVSSSQQIERAVANTIIGRPDLSRPAVELIAQVHEREWLLSELVSRTTNGWLGHEQRPHQYSSALPPRIARAMVNLVAVPGDRLIDPCCGSGTALVEASSMGIEPFGWEINRTIVEQAAANICHHQQAAWLVVGDGRTARGSWNGAVLDLPYGISSERCDDVARGLVEHALEVARLVAVVTVDDLSGLFAGCGGEVLGTATVIKNRLHRRVYWARSIGAC